jgi:heme-degrading monooxygenase HmoA
VYAAITRATRATGGNMAEEAVMVGETMVTWLRDVEGFEGFLMLTDEDSGAVQVIALWESREIAEHHRAARARLRERISATAGVELGETVGFDVPYAFFNR